MINMMFDKNGEHVVKMFITRDAVYQIEHVGYESHKATMELLWCSLLLKSKQGTMVRTPRPGWPIIIPQALRYSISLEAFDLSPIFSLSRWILKPAFFRPSGRQRGTTKQDMPSLLWARVKKASLIGAEVNHL